MSRKSYRGHERGLPCETADRDNSYRRNARGNASHDPVNVEWGVSDPDGDLEQVTIDVYDVSQTASPITSETIAGSGSAGDDVQTLSIKHGSGSSYRVVLEVSDGEHAVADEREIDA